MNSNNTAIDTERNGTLVHAAEEIVRTHGEVIEDA